MKEQLVVTVTGPDRPGFVEQITDAICQHDGNVEASRMARLGGEFALLALVSVSGRTTTHLSGALERLNRAGEFHVQLRPAQGEDHDRFGGHQAYALEVNGADHPGIVHIVSRSLASQGINIENMDTAVTEAPLSGAPLFSMKAKIFVPDVIEPAALQSALEAVGRELAVDVEIEEVP